MRVIIAGSRSGFSYQDIENAVAQSNFIVKEVVSGTAPGVDSLGEQWAVQHNIQVKRMPAKWRVNGVFIKSAGYKRNVEMAEYGDALIALWDGESKGTCHMIDIANNLHLPVFIFGKGAI